MVIIPSDRLDPLVLHNLVEEFVTREGTEYGFVEVSLETKVRQVLEQLARGEVIIVFDEESQSCNLVCRENFPL